MARYHVDCTNELVDATLRAQSADSICLGANLCGWNLRLTDDGWVLTNGNELVALRGPGGARVRFIHDDAPFLLVGDNGHASIQAAIDAAEGGETILVAPGTYGEGRAFAASEMAGVGLQGDNCGLVINKPVTLQGVTDAGLPILDCDEVVAAAIALFQSVNGESFIAAAPGISIRGLGFVPAGGHGSNAGMGRVFGIYRERFHLSASVIESNPVRRGASAIHVGRQEGRDPAQGLCISGCVIHGSLTFDGPDVVAPMSVEVVNNDIIGDLLPPIRMDCDARALAATPAAALPILQDNTLLPSGQLRMSLCIQHVGTTAEALRSRGFDAVLGRLLENQEGTGAILVDGATHARAGANLLQAAATAGVFQKVGVYASVQAALDHAQQGDRIYIGASVYQEQFDTSGKRLSLLEVINMTPHPRHESGRSAVALPPGGSDVRCYAVIDPEGSSPPGEDQGGEDAGHWAEEEAMNEADYELDGEDILSLLDDAARDVPPVHHYGRDGRKRGGYSGIQAALDAAEDGDRIEIAPGSFVGNLRIEAAVALQGANAGKPGGSHRRGVESEITGHVVINLGAADVSIDGFTILGTLTIEGRPDSNPHLALRCCVIDGSDASTAIAMLGGSCTMISNNLIFGGTDEAIHAPNGFDNMVISGNRLHVADGAAGIALSGSAGLDSAYILGNTTVGGDYGVLIEVDEGLEQPGDSITIAGNCFGEWVDGEPGGGPAIAAIYADAPLPEGLQRSLGASLGTNTFNNDSTSVRVDVTFDTRGRAAQASGFPGQERARG